MDIEENKEKEVFEKLIELKRVTKVVKGGRRFSFSALAVAGDKNGKIGLGFGKANDVADTIRKATERAKKNMIHVAIKNGTIPHDIVVVYKKSKVMLRPATKGTGLIAGSTLRPILEMLGLSDIMTKVVGSRNVSNVAKGAFLGLERLMDAQTVAENRHKTLSDMWR